MGNAAGIILPKPVLQELGVSVGDELSMSMEKGRVTLIPARARARAGWAAASKDIAAAGDDELAWPEFANAEDKRLRW